MSLLGCVRLQCLWGKQLMGQVLDDRPLKVMTVHQQCQDMTRNPPQKAQYHMRVDGTIYSAIQWW